MEELVIGFLEVVLKELLGPILRGFFVRASTPEIRVRRFAAWVSLLAAIFSIVLLTRTEQPFAHGIVIGMVICCAVASPVFSVSAWITSVRHENQENAVILNRECPGEANTPVIPNS